MKTFTSLLAHIETQIEQILIIQRHIQKLSMGVMMRI